MSDWYDKRAAKIVLGFNTEKGQDDSINRILPELEKLKGNVLEIGAGSGNLLKYLPANIHYTCIEPNIYLHDSIRTEAVKAGITEVNIIKGTAEKMGLPDNFFDAVISIRSLCSVDTEQVLQQIKRVLKPGGLFIFVEHVAAKSGSPLWFIHHIIRYPHKLLRNGCDPAKNTGHMISHAGFSEVKIEGFNTNRFIAKHRISGIAFK